MCPAGPAVITPALCFGEKAGRPAVAARTRALTVRGRRTRSNGRPQQRLLRVPDAGRSSASNGPTRDPPTLFMMCFFVMYWILVLSSFSRRPTSKALQNNVLLL